MMFQQNLQKEKKNSSSLKIFQNQQSFPTFKVKSPTKKSAVFFLEFSP